MTKNEAIFKAGMLTAAIGPGCRLLDEVEHITRRHQDDEQLPDHVLERVESAFLPYLQRLGVMAE